MSDFVNTLHKFCSSHKHPPQGMAFGGKMQLCLYVNVTSSLGLGEFWDYDFVEKDYPPRMGRIANEFNYSVTSVVKSICGMLTFVDNCASFSKETLKQDMSNILKRKPNLYALEYALALISYKVGGSQKSPPAKLKQKFENGKLEKDFERLLSKWAFHNALRIAFGGNTSSELIEVMPLGDKNWAKQFDRCLNAFYVLLDKATDEMVAAIKNPASKASFDFTALADLTKEEQEELLYDSLGDSGRYFKRDVLPQILRDLHRHTRTEKFVSLLENGSYSDDIEDDKATLTISRGDDYCTFDVSGKVVKNKVILTYSLTSVDSDNDDSSIQVPDFLYGKDYVTESI